MRQRVWLFTAVGLFVLLGGLLVFLRPLGAKPEKEDSGDPAARKAGAFDGDRALTYLSTICEIGPRLSGSEGMTKQQDMLKRHFEKHGATVTLQKFEGKQPSREKAVPMANMIVSWHAKSNRRVMICGHYDTRPIADQEPNFRDWTKPFVSANDGTSTVAFMMELAHQMKDLKTEVGVDFVLFDAEEFIHKPNEDKFFLGSEHFAAEHKKAKDGPKYVAGVLLDLFAGKGATYPVENNSAWSAGELCKDIWGIAAELEVKHFKWEPGPEVLDDHIALNKAGIPCVDIIDFDYKHWHRLSDTPDKCSAESMASVAKVIVAWLQRVK